MNPLETIQVLLFGSIAEIIGKSQMVLPVFPHTQDLLNYLLKEYPQLQTVGFVLSVNRKIVNESPIKSNDEIALLPPFSGG